MRSLMPVVVLSLAVGCGALPCADIEKTPEFEQVQQSRQAIDDRLLVAMRAGVAEARRRGADVPADEDLPTAARLPDGELDPMVKRYAQDGNGRLRGEGDDMSTLEGYLEQNLRYLKEKQDKLALERCLLQFRS